MTTVTVFIGSSFDNGTEWDDLDFPVVPRVGEYINQNGRRDAVTQVEHYVGAGNEVLVRILIPAESEPYDMNALIG